MIRKHCPSCGKVKGLTSGRPRDPREPSVSALAFCTICRWEGMWVDCPSYDGSQRRIVDDPLDEHDSRMTPGERAKLLADSQEWLSKKFSGRCQKSE